MRYLLLSENYGIRKLKMHKFIKKRLQNYKVSLNKVDYTHSEKIDHEKKVAIIGSGLAGLSAAVNLAERGFKVKLFERNDYIGGKVGSWVENNERVEHGFHAFFKQYYNLRNFLERLNLSKHLIPISDYQIKFNPIESIGFSDISTTPILNILDLGKKGLFSFKEIMLNPRLARLMSLLSYDPKITFEKFDHMTFEEFANDIKLSKKMRIVFNTFSRAFFEEPDKISMAQLIKGFHFYFLSNDLGLVYDVLDDDFEFTLLKPIREHLEKYKAEIKLNCNINRIQKFDKHFIVDDEKFDYLILSTDANATKKIVLNSADLESLHKSFSSVQSAGYYAVLRIWMKKRIGDSEPFFIFTDREDVLDSVTFYHNMEKSSKKWADEHNGGIYELHAYSIPKSLENDSEKVREKLLQEFFNYYPELRDTKIINEVFQFRNDFASYQKGRSHLQVEIETDIENLYVCGDWVKMDNPTMLMEAAYTSGAISANHILKLNKSKTFPLYSVPNRGVFAKKMESK